MEGLRKDRASLEFECFFYINVLKCEVKMSQDGFQLYSTWTVPQIKQELSRRGASTKGKKKDLVER